MRAAPAQPSTRPLIRSTTAASAGLQEVVAKFELPTYDAAVRPEDVDLWLTAMRDANGFKGVDTSKLTFEPRS